MFYPSLYYSIFYPFMKFKATYRPLHGSGRIGSNQFWTQLEIDPPMSNGRWKDLKPTININWLSQFRVQVKVIGICKSHRNLQKSHDSTKILRNLLGFEWIWLNLTRSSWDLVKFGMISYIASVGSDGSGFGEGN